MLFLSMSIDPKACATSLQRLYSRLHPALQQEFDREVGNEIQRELRHVGLNLEQFTSLASLVGPEFTIAATTPGTRSLVPDFFAFVQVQDEAAVLRQIRRLQEHEGIGLKTIQHQDHEVWYTSIVANGNRLPIAPAATLVDGHLVICSQLRSLRKLLSNRPAQADSLAGDARFRATIQSAGPTTVFCNLRVGPILDLVWESALPMAEAFIRSHPELGLEPEALPTPEQLAAAIEDSMTAFTVQPDGIRVRQRACVGFGAAVAVAGAVLDHVLGELLPKARTY
jgi:hypothetical protein